MKAELVWKDLMAFEASADGHTITMDAKAPIGKGSAPTPKELVAMGLGGCTAMDVIALLKKYKQPPQSFQVSVDITSSQGKQPAVFVEALISFIVQGPVEPEKLMEAVTLSQTKYCGVSAMLAQSFPIRYRVLLNGTEIGSGEAKFS